MVPSRVMLMAMQLRVLTPRKQETLDVLVERVATAQGLEPAQEVLGVRLLVAYACALQEQRLAVEEDPGLSGATAP